MKSVFRLWIASSSLTLLTVFATLAQPASPLPMLQKELAHTSLQRLSNTLYPSLKARFTLELTHQFRVASSTHQRFAAHIEGLPLYPYEVIVTKGIGEKIRVRYPDLPSNLQYGRLDTADIRSSVDRFMNALGETSYTSDIKLVIINDSCLPISVLRYMDYDDLTEVWLHPSGRVLWQGVRSLHARRDTTIQVNTYQPDPLTQAGVAYGPPYSDANDMNNAALDELLISDTTFLSFDSASQSWVLASGVAVAVDITPPSFAPPSYSSLPGTDFRVVRSDTAFEYFNVFYHLHCAQRHYDQLGFADIRDQPLAYDALGGTADQSSFVVGMSGTYLRFGTGGVDDAEDADVIQHEYGHYVLHRTSPNSNFGAERGALEEGFCDYLAVSYSRKLSDNNRHTIFDWDGHNEFWEGRTLTNNRTYPTDLQNNIYADGLLWASALAEISDLIGTEVTDELAIHSTLNWFPYMRMTDASRQLLASDSMLFNAVHAEQIQAVLCVRGLLAGCEDTLLSSTPFSEPYLGNSFDFAYNNEALFIYPNRKEIVDLEVFTLDGHLIHHETWEPLETSFKAWHPTGLPQGMFVLRLLTAEEDFSFKIVKLW